MDNIKKFEDFLDRMQGLLDNAKKQGHIIVRVEDLENTFPELRKSEDERVRKALLEMVHDTTGDELWIDYNVHKEEALAWLEKQGEKKASYTTIVETGNGGINALVTRELSTNGYSEQKSANEVEPKFKVGDWIVNNQTSTICLVKSIKDNKYCIWPLDAETEGFLRIVDVDSEYHLWTIQDAKDGDILCTYECCEPKIVFILKGTPKKHYALSYHCYYNIMYPHFSPDSEKGCLAPNDEDVKPATKEQRDLLFKKMHEAGYEWDEEKKELKLLITNGGDFESENCEQKSAWSEEDECILFRTINDLKFLKDTISIDPKYAINIIDIEREIDWLKSLKDRYTWKPSDEQMKALHDLNLTGNLSYAGQGQVLIELYNDLKKLKE